MRKAVGVVLRRESDAAILTVTRAKSMRFFPGYSSFPGGKVESGENSRQAALRELLEEVSLPKEFLTQYGSEEEREQSLELIGTLITPPFFPYRFETDFFQLVLPDEVAERTCGECDEFSWTGWLTPEQIRSQFEEGDLLMVPPMRAFVFRQVGLTVNEKLKTPMADLIWKDSELARFEIFPQLEQLIVPAKTLPPADSTNCFLIGPPEDLVMVDPSPRDQEAYEKLLRSLPEQVAKIFITHGHSDHRAEVEKLAAHYNAKVLMHQKTWERLPSELQVTLKDFYIEVKAGDRVTTWQGHDVTVSEIPGHHVGQIGLSDGNGKWFLAGDLFQGIGSVVIGGDEGDLKDYMRSLAMVIDQEPGTLLPSHGAAVGGVEILKRVYGHRKTRHEQVQELAAQFKTEDEILETLYFNVPDELHPYARKNIQAHLMYLEETFEEIP